MDTIVIEEEDQLPQCRWCGLFGRGVLNRSHTESDDCNDFFGEEKVSLSSHQARIGEGCGIQCRGTATQEEPAVQVFGKNIR